MKKSPIFFEVWSNVLNEISSYLRGLCVTKASGSRVNLLKININFLVFYQILATTLASGIEVGQGINVGPGEFGKKNKRRALNTHVLCSK